MREITFNGIERIIVDKEEGKVKNKKTGGYIKSEQKIKAIIEKAEMEENREVLKMTKEEFKNKKHTIESQDGTKKVFADGQFKEVKIA